MADLSLDDFSRWSVTNLKEFLRKRGLPVTGRKDELAALCYGASTLKSPLVATPSEMTRDKALHYTQLLKMEDGTQLPDPFSDLTGGWVGETAGISKWPPTMYFDIAQYILSLTPSSDRDRELGVRLMSDYKEGKGYSYFTSSFVQEVQYHTISEDSTFCFLRAECVPSQNVRHTPHKLWICINKKTGCVHSAYCTCFAGLGGTCNHIAAVLFKVDFVWQKGWTNTSCTSKECEWMGTFSSKQIVEPMRACDMVLCKPQYKKGAAGMSSSGINPVARQLFNPTSKVSREAGLPSLKTLVNALFASCPEASVWHYVETEDPPSYSPASDFNVDHVESVLSTAGPPCSLPDLATDCETVGHFLSSLPTYNQEEVTSLTEFTRGQASNDAWRKMRVGRVTGSTAHNVLTRVRTIQKATGVVDTAPLVRCLMGYVQPSSTIPALKYGRLKEPVAAQMYASIVKKSHSDVELDFACGLHVCTEHIYIGASPDGFVKCSCCGMGLVEIKCPLSIADRTPQSANLPYLKKSSEGHLQLRHSHAYYTQMQVQMGVTGRNWCDFFIYTNKGYHLERIQFDAALWTEMVQASKLFFEDHLAPEIVYGVLKRHTTVEVAAPETPSRTSAIVKPKQAFAPPLPSASSSKRQRPSKRRALNAKPVYLCGACKSPCEEEDKLVDITDSSVGCDQCYSWYHWGCVGFDPEDPQESWCCPACQ